MDTSVSYISYGTLGWGKEKDPSKATHVAISREYYNYLEGQRVTIENLKRNVNSYENERGKYQPTINRLREQVAQLTAERDKAVAEANDAWQMEEEMAYRNETLYHMHRERVNAARGLKPKKEHSGYCVLQSKQMERRYHDNTEVMWETTVQTPIQVEWDYGQAYVIAMKHLLGMPERTTDKNKPKYRKCEGLLYECGIDLLVLLEDKAWYHSLIFMQGREKVSEYETKVLPTPIERTTAYDFFMQQDYRSGLWNLVFSHTHPLEKVPMYLRPAPKVDKKKGSQKEKKKETE